MNSILNSIKKLLGMEENYDHFDTDLIIHINSILAVLAQMGVGRKGFTIKDATETWDQFIVDEQDMETLKSYVYMRVRLLFDPPTTAHLVESFNKMISEFEFRMFVEADPVLELPEIENDS